MTVVNPDKVVEVAVLQEGVAVHDVHDDVERREGDEAVDGECDALWVEKSQDLTNYCFWSRLYAAGSVSQSIVIQPPDNRRSVNEWIDLKVHGEAQQESSNSNPLCQHCP